jgi:hypothetical protein
MCAIGLWLIVTATLIALLGEWPGLIVSVILTLFVILFSFAVNRKKGK